MKKNSKFPFLVGIVMVLFSGNVYAGTYSMISLYTNIPSLGVHCDCMDMPPPMYLATFTGAGSSDNETGDASFGTLSMDVEGRTFDNETGTYRSGGAIFTGSWTASEDDAEATTYYAQTVDINYAFFFVGMFLFDDSLVFGSFFTSTGSSISEPVSGFSLFLGILVSDS